jgi:signal transduction histidine kinase/phage shock protein PspC (stress-responsive transcriptional regulator)
VAGGLAERLGVDPVVIRFSFVVLGLAGGAGAICYLLLWMLSANPEGHAVPALIPSAMRPTIATISVVTGSLLVLRGFGIWLGDGVVWPVALAATGSAVIWSRGRHVRVAPLRIVAGVLLIAASIASFLAQHVGLNTARNLVFAVAITIAAIALLLGPWIWRIGKRVAEEQRDRIRSEERAEMAAHLHDSVLQTLALIQRSSAPGGATSLARRQERELRAWLYRRSSPEERATLNDAIDALAARVEEGYRVRVDAVVVGDRALDERLKALVDACGEAATNAARHSGANSVSLYVEADDSSATAYVRDQGRGFAVSSVPHDRRGIADSIRGRVERYGGTASIKTAPGEGTEVHLYMPRNGNGG